MNSNTNSPSNRKENKATVPQPRNGNPPPLFVYEDTESYEGSLVNTSTGVDSSHVNMHNASLLAINDNVSARWNRVSDAHAAIQAAEDQETALDNQAQEICDQFHTWSRADAGYGDDFYGFQYSDEDLYLNSQPEEWCLPSDDDVCDGEDHYDHCDLDDEGVPAWKSNKLGYTFNQESEFFEKMRKMSIDEDVSTCTTSAQTDLAKAELSEDLEAFSIWIDDYLNSIPESEFADPHKVEEMIADHMEKFTGKHDFNELVRRTIKETFGYSSSDSDDDVALSLLDLSKAEKQGIEDAPKDYDMDGIHERLDQAIARGTLTHLERSQALAEAIQQYENSGHDINAVKQEIEHGWIKPKPRIAQFDETLEFPQNASDVAINAAHGSSAEFAAVMAEDKANRTSTQISPQSWIGALCFKYGIHKRQIKEYGTNLAPDMPSFNGVLTTKNTAVRITHATRKTQYTVLVEGDLSVPWADTKGIFLLFIRPRGLLYCDIVEVQGYSRLHPGHPDIFHKSYQIWPRFDISGGIDFNLCVTKTGGWVWSFAEPVSAKLLMLAFRPNSVAEGSETTLSRMSEDDIAEVDITYPNTWMGPLTMFLRHTIRTRKWWVLYNRICLENQDNAELVDMIYTIAPETVPTLLSVSKTGSIGLFSLKREELANLTTSVKAMVEAYKDEDKPSPEITPVVFAHEALRSVAMIADTPPEVIPPTKWQRFRAKFGPATYAAIKREAKAVGFQISCVVTQQAALFGFLQTMLFYCVVWLCTANVPFMFSSMSGCLLTTSLMTIWARTKSQQYYHWYQKYRKGVFIALGLFFVWLVCVLWSRLQWWRRVHKGKNHPEEDYYLMGQRWPDPTIEKPYIYQPTHAVPSKYTHSTVVVDDATNVRFLGNAMDHEIIQYAKDHPGTARADISRDTVEYCKQIGVTPTRQPYFNHLPPVTKQGKRTWTGVKGAMEFTEGLISLVGRVMKLFSLTANAEALKQIKDVAGIAHDCGLMARGVGDMYSFQTFEKQGVEDEVSTDMRHIYENPVTDEEADVIHELMTKHIPLSDKKFDFGNAKKFMKENRAAIIFIISFAAFSVATVAGYLYYKKKQQPEKEGGVSNIVDARQNMDLRKEIVLLKEELQQQDRSLQEKDELLRSHEEQLLEPEGKRAHGGVSRGDRATAVAHEFNPSVNKSNRKSTAAAITEEVARKLYNPHVDDRLDPDTLQEVLGGEWTLDSTTIPRVSHIHADSLGHYRWFTTRVGNWRSKMQSDAGTVDVNGNPVILPFTVADDGGGDFFERIKQINKLTTRKVAPSGVLRTKTTIPYFVELAKFNPHTGITEPKTWYQVVAPKTLDRAVEKQGRVAREAVNDQIDRLTRMGIAFQESEIEAVLEHSHPLVQLSTLAHVKLSSKTHEITQQLTLDSAQEKFKEGKTNNPELDITKMQRSIGIASSNGMSGNGFVIDNMMVTAYHDITSVHQVRPIAKRDSGMPDVLFNGSYVGPIHYMNSETHVDLAVFTLPVNPPSLRYNEEQRYNGPGFILTKRENKSTTWMLSLGNVFIKNNQLMHTIPTMAGDSGSPIFDMSGSVRGMHLGHCGNNNYGVPVHVIRSCMLGRNVPVGLTQTDVMKQGVSTLLEFVDELYHEGVDNRWQSQPSYIDYPEPVKINLGRHQTDFIKVAGYMKGDALHHVQNLRMRASAYGKFVSSTDYLVGVEMQMASACSTKYSTMVPNPRMIFEDVTKYSTPPHFCPCNKTLQRAHTMFNEFLALNVKSPKIRTNEEAEASMPKSTSPGYPWNQHYTTKQEVYDAHRQFIYDFADKYLSDPDFDPEFIYCQAGKEEIRLTEKVEANKGRTMNAADLLLTHIENRLYGDMQDQFCKMPYFYKRSALGATPWYGGWDDMIRWLDHKANSFVIDFRKWDSSIQGQQTILFVISVIELFRNCSVATKSAFWKHAWQSIFSLMLVQVPDDIALALTEYNAANPPPASLSELPSWHQGARRYIRNKRKHSPESFTGALYRSKGGTKSGSFITLLKNCLDNIFAGMYAFLKQFEELLDAKFGPDNQIPYAEYDDAIRNLVVGDDNAATVMNETYIDYNPVIIEPHFKSLGLNMDPHDGILRHIAELDFIGFKSIRVAIDGHEFYLPVPDLDKVWYALSITRSGASAIDYLDKIEALLQLSFAYMFTDKRCEVLMLMTYREFYLSQHSDDVALMQRASSLKDEHQLYEMLVATQEGIEYQCNAGQNSIKFVPVVMNSITTNTIMPNTRKNTKKTQNTKGLKTALRKDIKKSIANAIRSQPKLKKTIAKRQKQAPRKQNRNAPNRVRQAMHANDFRKATFAIASPMEHKPVRHVTVNSTAPTAVANPWIREDAQWPTTTTADIAVQTENMAMLFRDPVRAIMRTVTPPAVETLSTYDLTVDTGTNGQFFSLGWSTDPSVPLGQVQTIPFGTGQLNSSSGYAPHGTRLFPAYSDKVAGKFFPLQRNTEEGGSTGIFKVWLAAGQSATPVVTIQLMKYLPGAQAGDIVSSTSITSTNVASSPVSIVPPNQEPYAWYTLQVTQTTNSTAILFGGFSLVQGGTVYGQLPLPFLVPNYASVDTLRVAAGSVMFSNKASALNKQGKVAGNQMPADFSPSILLNSAKPFDIVASSNTSCQKDAAKGLYGFLKPTQPSDADFFELGAIVEATRGYCLENKHDYLVVCTDITTAGGQDGYWTYAFGLEYRTRDTWRDQEYASMPYNDYLDAQLYLKEIPQWEENPFHLIKLAQAIRSGARIAAGAIAKYGPVAIDYAQRAQRFLE